MTIRNKQKLGSQFIQAFDYRNRSVGPETPAQQSKQWRGKHARKKIRGADKHESKFTSLDAATAISLFSPGVKGAYVNKNGSCVEDKWKDAGARTKSDVVNHVVDAVHHVAKSFCPNDSLALVQTVFRTHGYVNTDERDYNQWAKNPLIKLMLQQYMYVYAMCDVM